MAHLFWHSIWHLFWHFLACILTSFLTFYLALFWHFFGSFWNSIWYIFEHSLWSKSRGNHVYIYISLGFCWGPAGTTAITSLQFIRSSGKALILGLLFGSGRDQCDHELAVKVCGLPFCPGTADIKSNNPCLTGGEKTMHRMDDLPLSYPCVVKSDSPWVAGAQFLHPPFVTRPKP